jgi:hypothetical protein
VPIPRVCLLHAVGFRAQTTGRCPTSCSNVNASSVPARHIGTSDLEPGRVRRSRESPIDPLQPHLPSSRFDETSENIIVAHRLPGVTRRGCSKTHFYLANFGCFEENELFQHPRLIATVENGFARCLPYTRSEPLPAPNPPPRAARTLTSLEFVADKLRVTCKPLPHRQ